MPARLARTLLPVLAATALTVAGCSTGTDAAAADDTVPSVDFSTELTHLHGLHLGADGAVVAGTHTGLFAVDSTGTTTLVGNSDDDFMGLTGVPGTDTVYASGHPGPSSFAANPLGLRSSTDGGTSWMDRSLAGQVDFHTLAADDGLLVGFDGTTGLLVSTDDGTTWASGAALPAAALAITPGGVWAITETGLQRSTDAARTFTPAPGAPALTLLAGAGNALWGIDADGYAWRSREGANWEKRERVGQVEALTAKDYDTAYAATATTLYTLS
jgi:hypothetical protein